MTTLTAPHGIVDAPPRDAVTPRPAATRRPVTVADRTLAGIIALAAAPATLRADLEERRRNAAGPVVVIFVVAIAVLLALAAAVSAAVVIYCANKGMNFEWFVKTSWFEVKVACSK